METETTAPERPWFGDLKEPSNARHEVTAPLSAECPQCRPTAYAAAHARHKRASLGLIDGGRVRFVRLGYGVPAHKAGV